MDPTDLTPAPRRSDFAVHSLIHPTGKTAKVAGAAGIEPANAGIKIRCLTAWRRPILEHLHAMATH